MTNRKKFSQFFPISATTDDHANVDKALCSGLKISIEGWIFHPSEDVVYGEATVYSDHRQQSFRLKTGLERTDVSGIHGQRGLRSGFRLTCTVAPECGRSRYADLVFHMRGTGRRVILRAILRREAAPSYAVLWHSRRFLDRKALPILIGAALTGQIGRLYLDLEDSYLNHEVKKEAVRLRPSLEHALEYLGDRSRQISALTEPVDIVIPVYNGFVYLDPLLDSINSCTSYSHRVILVDDCSTDDRVYPRLQKFASDRPNVVVERLDWNQGFVGAVNHGISLTSHDFVILNTDTVVTPDWLERLIAPLLRDGRVASVTPFSNSATICSFPNFCEDNDLLGGLSAAEIDRWFRYVDTSRIDVELPTGVGFCMAVRRQAWQDVGPFDHAAFKQGYGEENDWCQRAMAAGYTNAICPNLFVYHKHGGTFESSRRALLQDRGYKTVVRRHPTYPQQVSDFVERDPLRALRDIMTLLVVTGIPTAPCHLVVDHGWGGGANSYTNGRVDSLLKQGCSVLRLVITRPGELAVHPEPYSLELRFGDLQRTFRVGKRESLMPLLQLVRPQTVVLNELVTDQDPLRSIDMLIGLKQAVGFRLVVPIHEYYAICPSYTLLNAKGCFCDVPTQDVCRSCLPSNSFASNPRNNTIGDWREGWRRLFAVADEVVCFSRASLALLLKVYPELESRAVVRSHELTVKFDRLPHLTRSEDMRIGVVGKIGYQKGSRVVRRLARLMLRENPSAKIIVIGSMDETENLPNIQMTGAYEPEDLPFLIERERLSFVFFPSIWPETFSYVIHEIIDLDVPLIAFDLGAPGDRVRSYEWGRAISVELAEDPSRLHAELVDFWENCRKTAATRQ